MEQKWDEEILGKIPQQERSKKRVEKILAYSLRAIEKDGVNALNLNLVAKASGVNVASIYQFFPSKNAVIARLAVRTFDENYQKISTALGPCRSAQEVQAAFVTAFLSLYKQSCETVFLRELWAILEADRDLNMLNKTDDERLARLFATHYLRFAPDRDADTLYRRALLLVGMCAFAIRTAMKLPEKEAENLIREAALLQEEVM